MRNRFYDIYRAVTGTCEWLHRHKMYQSWATSDRGLLWIRGKPGSGKSTLVKYALDNHGARDNALVLSFFFHGRGDELQRTPLGLFRSLLHQVLRQAPGVLQDLVTESETKHKENGKPGEDWHWHEEELRPFIESCLPKVSQTRPVWLFVDALDECGKDNAVRLVEIFKTLLKSLVSQSVGLGQFRICFSCRHYPILDLDEDGFEICTEAENQRDIATFVDGQLASFWTRSSAIPALITKRSSGVFMWARLVVKQVLDLYRDGMGPKKIEAAVFSIPPDLDTLYRQLIQNMVPASLKLIQWVCFATRPLSLDELRWAMVIDADCPHRSLQICQSAEDYVPDSTWMKRQVQTLGRGLVEVTSTQVVQFIHQSVKDFFVEKGLSALDNNITPTEAAIRAHFRFSRICIRYLGMEEIGRSTSYEDDNFPFLRYATTSWVAHTRQCDAESVYQDDLLALFAWPSNDLVGLWARVYQTIDSDSYDCPPEGTSLVHVVSRYGVFGILMLILQRADEAKVDVDARDKDRQTPLWWAARNGHEAVFKLLLGTGKVDVDARDKYRQATPLWWASRNGHEAIFRLLLGTCKVDVDLRERYNGETPLWWAARNGHEAVVKLLLDTSKVDVDVRDTNRYSGATPLWWAARNGHEAVVKLLLDTGKADIDARDAYNQATPLWWAARNGHEAVVQLLLGTGKADIDARGDDDQTPLSWAARNGHEAVVRLLLGICKVDIDTRDKYGRTPLWWAAQQGHEAVVKLLLDMGKADIDTRDEDNRTPLSWAAMNGHEAVAKLLLGTGKADIDSKDKSSRTPLWWAAQQGHEAVVKLLLSKADADTRDKYGRTPLSLAAEDGHEAVFRLLLSTGKVDVDARDKYSRVTPLWWAARNGHKIIVKLLLDTGKVDADTRDRYSQTPLSWAAQQGHEAVVKLLLSKADIDTRDEDNRTPLSWAAMNGHEAIAKLLLGTSKADIESKDKFGRTPLSLAAGNGKEAMVKLLLGTGKVDTDARDKHGRTPLSFAAQQGKEAVVKLLLGIGKANADARDEAGQTPLSWAAEHGQAVVVKLLLGTGKVDVDARDEYDRTPLSWAAKKGHEAVVQLLLSTGASVE